MKKHNNKFQQISRAAGEQVSIEFPLNFASGASKFLCISLCTVLISITGILAPKISEAQDSLTLTLTPPLFKINLEPGDVWRSSVKAVNANPYDLDLYANVLNFEAQGERGQAKFIPVTERIGMEGTLAEWIEVEDKAIHVEREASQDIPFTLRVPENAAPGGHYAAILVGTKPLKENLEGSGISVSSLISSLLFVEVQGDIREEGRIREFKTDKSVYQTPEAKLTLTFENSGNVHVQPRGKIRIYNMWGKERGDIPINEGSEFGNILPKSSRSYVFVWKGEKNAFEAGRYKAEASITYGRERPEQVTQAVYFWIIPLKSIGLIGGGIGAFFGIIIWLIRIYVKRILKIESQKRGVPRKEQMQEEIVDLRNIQITRKRKLNVIKYYKMFFVVAFLVTGALILLGYLRAVTTSERNFEIIIPKEERTL